jgi:hypothetical protein
LNETTCYKPSSHRETANSHSACGMLMLIIGLGMMGNNWARDAYAPLAVVSGLFLLCFAALEFSRKTP